MSEPREPATPEEIQAWLNAMGQMAANARILDEPELLGLDIDMMRCIACGAKATLLCDGIIAQEWGLATQVRCSRPLCAEHAFEAMHGFLCGEDGCERITWDYCPECVAAHRHEPWYYQIRSYAWMGCNGHRHAVLRKETKGSPGKGPGPKRRRRKSRRKAA